MQGAGGGLAGTFRDATLMMGTVYIASAIQLSMLTLPGRVPRRPTVPIPSRARPLHVRERRLALLKDRIRQPRNRIHVPRIDELGP